MILISHRGNINGKNPNKENNPMYITKALQSGYDVEVDVWYKNGEWFLGHDGPKYRIDEEYLTYEKLWCHAKNIEALNLMLKKDIHCFWHQKDDVTLTSCGFMWTYPGKPLTENSVVVLPELKSKTTLLPPNVFGVCSDYIVNYKDGE